MRHSAWAIYTGDGDDNFAGGAYRFRPSVAVNAGLVAGATVRLENVHTLQELRPHYNLQREEATRLLAWAGAEGVLHLAGPVGAYAGLAVGRCIGDQSGTSVDPESAWTPVIDAGLSYNVQYEGMGGMVRAGYQYANRVTSDDHAASLGLGLEF